MRGVERAVPNCAHMHADDDKQLVQEVMKHAGSVHPEMDFPEATARQFVEIGAYDDTRHAPATGDAQTTQ